MPIARVEVVTTEREELVERVGVRLGLGGIGGHRIGEAVKLRARSRDPGAAREVVAQRLARARVRLLGQEADGQRLRRPLDHPGVQGDLSGERPEQRGLADAVRADDPEPVPRRHRDGDLVEDEPPAERDRHVLGRQHAPDPRRADPTRPADTTVLGTLKHT